MNARTRNNLTAVHGALDILLVGKNEKTHAAELLFLRMKRQQEGNIQNGHQFRLRNGNTVCVRTVDNVDDGICLSVKTITDTCIWVIAPPEGANRRLSSQIPHLECQIVVLDLQRHCMQLRKHGFHIEANRGDGGNWLVKLESVYSSAGGRECNRE